ncbi:MAG: DUF255 domain-containing protein [Bacteroidales bacterium]|nr:DUF255 domain-containing protein [Bacteroidales bacterium]
MKKALIITLFAMFGLRTLAQEKQETIHWINFEEAVEHCATEPKMVFIDVYTDWCGWCKRMDQTTFVNPVIAKYMNEHFYCVKFDAERQDTITFKGQQFAGRMRPDGRRGSHQLAQALLRGKMSYPSYVIMNEQIQALQVIGGYQEAKQFEPMIHYFGDEAYKAMSGEDFLKDFRSELE